MRFLLSAVVGTSTLPIDISVEVEAIVQIEPLAK